MRALDLLCHESSERAFNLGLQRRDASAFIAYDIDGDKASSTIGGPCSMKHAPPFGIISGLRWILGEWFFQTHLGPWRERWAEESGGKAGRGSRGKKFASV